LCNFDASFLIIIHIGATISTFTIYRVPMFFCASAIVAKISVAHIGWTSLPIPIFYFHFVFPPQAPGIEIPRAFQLAG